MQLPIKSMLLAATFLAGAAGPALAEVPHVVASIKPIHALVASVMGDLGTPDLIVQGSASPHAYSLKPSNAAALQNADLVFWTGHGLEKFLEESITTLAPKAKIVELGDAPGITLLPPRESGTFEPHDHDGDGIPDDEEESAGHDHEHEEERDMHFFLDPENAILMVDAISTALSEVDPDDATTYAANAEATKADLKALETEVTAELAPVKDRPFIVFHDAYQYFEKRFSLNVAGSITVSPENAPGAARIGEIHAKLAELDAACVFAEPQFDKRVVDVLTEGTSAKQGVLDPEGADIDPGPGAYRTLIERLAGSLVSCLSK